MALPFDEAEARKLQLGIGGGRERLGPCRHFGGQRLNRGRLQQARLASCHGGVRHETQTSDLADCLTLNRNHAIFFYARHQTFLLGQPPHQYTGFAVNETMRKAFVQDVRQAVLDLLGPALPIERGLQPVRAVGDEGPGADVRNAGGERVDAALDIVAVGELLGEPLLGDVALAALQEGDDPAHQVGVFGGRDVAVIRDLAGLPGPLHVGGGGNEAPHAFVAADGLEGLHVGGVLGPGQALLLGQVAQALAQGIEGAEIQLPVPPLQHPDGIEVVVLQPVDHLLLEGFGLARDAEGAVIEEAPGAAGHLPQFGGREVAVLEAVELAGGSEGHMVHVHVEAHADRIGGDNIVHIARLVERDLGIAGAGRERPHDHSGTALLAADEFGHGVDHLGREGDDGRAARQAGELLLPGIGELREPGPRDEICPRKQLLENAPHGGGAEQHGLVNAAAVQDAVGEDVAALEIIGELDFIDRKERYVDAGRHGLDGADPVARLGGNDLLLAGDERDRMVARPEAHPVIDLAGQEAERQADHAAAMGQHAFHGEVGLACVGGAQDSGDGTAALAGAEGGHLSQRFRSSHPNDNSQATVLRPVLRQRLNLWIQWRTEHARIG